MDFSKLNFGVDGDSITAGEQWSYHVYKELGMASHHNVAVGSSVWYKRTIAYSGGSVTTQDYTSPDFAGISDGWEETDDPVELQKRANNCAVVHTQRFIEEVKSGKAPVPDVFAFAMGTNDAEDCLGAFRIFSYSSCVMTNTHLFARSIIYFTSPVISAKHLSYPSLYPRS